MGLVFHERLRELCDEWRNKRPQKGSHRFRLLRDAILLNAELIKRSTGKEADSIIFIEEEVDDE